MPQDRTDLSHVYDYYCTQRPTGQASETIFKIWERGEAFNDSITPSTYVPEYRSHIVLKVQGLTAETSTILSLGCGNGFVEGDLVANGRKGQAFDCLEEAVELTKAKGVDAFVPDLLPREPRQVGGVGVGHGDARLGHPSDSAQ